MTQLLEERLDQILDMRGQHQLQQEADRVPAAGGARAEPASEIQAVIRQTFAQANRHLAGRREHYELREVSQNAVGPLRAGRTLGHPIAFELCGGGRKLGKTLVVELTEDGMIRASLFPRAPELAVPRTRIDLGWRAVPLATFGPATACDLVVWYLTSVISRFSVAQAH